MEKTTVNKNPKSDKNQPSAPVSEPSFRPSSRLDLDSGNTSETGEEDERLGSDSIPYLGIAFQPERERPACSKAKKLSRSQLAEVENRLSARDHAVLQTIRKYRFLTSVQVGRLFFAECTTKTSRSRNCNLLLQRLGEYGLIRPLTRRVGGMGGGSSVQVWHLTEAGQRLLGEIDWHPFQAKVCDEPSGFVIDCGRVIKLHVFHKSDGHEIIGFERGWDKYPRGSHKGLAQAMIRFCESLPKQEIWSKTFRTERRFLVTEDDVLEFEENQSI